MKLRLSVLFALLVVISLLLSACANSGTAPTQENPAPANETAPNAEVSQPGQVEIRWFIGLGTGTDPDQLTAEQEVVDEFNATHPDIHLVTEIVTYEAAFDTLATELAAGNPPDIVGPMGVDGAESFHGQWLDLTPSIEKFGYDLTQFDEGAVNFYHTGGEGQLGIPFGVYPSVMYYNKPLFDEAGLNYPPHKYGEKYQWADGTESEWNYETVQKLAMLLTVDQNGKDANDPAFDSKNIVQYGYVPQYQDARAMGSYFGAGSLVAEDGKTAQIPAEWAAGWKWIYNGTWQYHFIPNQAVIDSPEMGAGDPFGGGRVAMALTHTWYYSEIALENWDMAAVPSYNGKTTANFNADTFRIMKTTKNADAAFTVMQYLLDDASLKLLNAYGAMPARKTDQADYLKALEGQYAWEPDWQVVTDSISYADNPSFEAWVPNYLEARARVANDFSSMLQSTEGVNMDDEIAKLLAELQVIFDKK
ncbi:MAG: sugar ABC transporter substrate-binding protein [Chloroflexi bacterium HGW-Chloroflexi-10]|nr:MAG: sugar ABC transporter substrate-binding protein [Chloroflexi bacterium HGW-Chloroflexi-10]